MLPRFNCLVTFSLRILKSRPPSLSLYLSTVLFYPILTQITTVDKRIDNEAFRTYAEPVSIYKIRNDNVEDTEEFMRGKYP